MDPVSHAEPGRAVQHRVPVHSVLPLSDRHRLCVTVPAPSQASDVPGSPAPARHHRSTVRYPLRSIALISVPEVGDTSVSHPTGAPVEYSSRLHPRPVPRLLQPMLPGYNPHTDLPVDGLRQPVAGRLAPATSPHPMWPVTGPVHSPAAGTTAYDRSEVVAPNPLRITSLARYRYPAPHVVALPAA